MIVELQRFVDDDFNRDELFESMTPDVRKRALINYVRLMANRFVSSLENAENGLKIIVSGDYIKKGDFTTQTFYETRITMFLDGLSINRRNLETLGLDPSDYDGRIEKLREEYKQIRPED